MGDNNVEIDIVVTKPVGDNNVELQNEKGDFKKLSRKVSEREVTFC